MGETSPRPRSSTPTAIPQKRPLNIEDEQHAPAVSSPLNPDYAAARARKQPTREQREKKESLKKREAKGGDSPRGGTPSVASHGKKSKKKADQPIILSPTRYKLPAPRETDFDPPKEPIFTPILTQAGRDFYECTEQ